MRSQRLLLMLVGCATAAFLFAFVVETEVVDALDGYLLALAVLVGLFLLTRIADTAQPLTWTPLDRPSQLDAATQRTGDLAKIRRCLITSGTVASARDELVEMTREVAADCLWRAHAVELERESARARELLGRAVWSVVRRDRQWNSAIKEDLLRDLVEQFERMCPPDEQPR